MRKQFMLVVSSVAMFQTNFSMTAEEFASYIVDENLYNQNRSKIQEEGDNGRLPIESVNTHGRVVKNISFAELTMRNGDTGMQFKNVKFHNVIFNGADLRRCFLYNCTFDHCRFIATKLHGYTDYNKNPVYSYIQNCKFIDCNFSRANLTLCIFLNTTIDLNTKLDGALLLNYKYDSNWLDYDTPEKARIMIDKVWKDEANRAEDYPETGKMQLTGHNFNNKKQAYRTSSRLFGQFLGCLRLNLMNQVLGAPGQRYDLKGATFNNANFNHATFYNPNLEESTIGGLTDLSKITIAGNYWNFSNAQIGSEKIVGSCYRDGDNYQGMEKLQRAHDNTQDETTRDLLDCIIKTINQRY